MQRQKAFLLRRTAVFCCLCFQVSVRFCLRAAAGRVWFGFRFSLGIKELLRIQQWPGKRRIVAGPRSGSPKLPLKMRANAFHL